MDKSVVSRGANGLWRLKVHSRTGEGKPIFVPIGDETQAASAIDLIEYHYIHDELDKLNFKPLKLFIKTQGLPMFDGYTDMYGNRIQLKKNKIRNLERMKNKGLGWSIDAQIEDLKEELEVLTKEKGVLK